MEKASEKATGKLRLRVSQVEMQGWASSRKKEAGRTKVLV